MDNEKDTQQNQDRPNKPAPSRALAILALAVAIIAALSICPWGKWTDNYIKDFNLLADITDSGETKATAEEPIDPELENALTETEYEKVTSDTITTPKGSNSSAVALTIPDSAHVRAAMPIPRNAAGDVLIEDYTKANTGMQRLRFALATGRQARIAVIGDSYIEGDILTGDLRRDLRKVYGGAGVGYMYLQSEIPGFRRTVRQTCSGWKQMDIRKNAKDAYRSLSGEYFVSTSKSQTTFKAAKGEAGWSRTRLLCIAPEGGSITISTDSETSTHTLAASPNVQCIQVEGTTKKASISTTTPGIVVLGAYLDGANGIAVDCMSLRGNSGVANRKTNIELAAQMRQYVDYDLIIIEYGINALTSKQKSYGGYSKLMVSLIQRLRACYPNADIMIMGIGDRGQKLGTQVKSMPTAQAMVDAQRDAARFGCALFWDTRAAMGGDNAVIEWRDAGEINPDYIHLNAKGGSRLAILLYNAIIAALK